MKELYIDEPSKWKTRELHQIHTADPVGVGRKSRQYTILTSVVNWHDFLSISTGSAVCMYLGQYIASSIFRAHLLYIQLLHLWCNLHTKMFSKIFKSRLFFAELCSTSSAVTRTPSCSRSRLTPGPSSRPFSSRNHNISSLYDLGIFLKRRFSYVVVAQVLAIEQFI